MLIVFRLSCCLFFWFFFRQKAHYQRTSSSFSGSDCLASGSGVSFFHLLGRFLKFLSGLSSSFDVVATSRFVYWNFFPIRKEKRSDAQPRTSEGGRSPRPKSMHIFFRNCKTKRCL
ncbi:unnamed protein product [Amoebophrya sp. A120]|nr:unnamed protein product [Amoebophrya sp. A120]|eukprot:GSA120T00010278001.1